MNHRLLLSLVVLFSVPACRDSEGGDPTRDDNKKVDLKSGNLGLRDPAALGLGNADEVVDEKTDLAIFMQGRSSNEVRNKLRKSLAKSTDRVKLAQDLLSNYSDEDDPARGANLLSMTMRQWSGEFALAISRAELLEPSVKETMISIHSSAQVARKNEKGLRDMYSALDPGVNRTRVAASIARLSYKQGGIKSSLSSISTLDFQPERIQALDDILSHASSQLASEKISGSSGQPAEVTFTSDDRQLVEKFVEGWEHTGNIQNRLDSIELLQSSSTLSPQDFMMKSWILSQESKEE
jgi:hypothetical protein